MSLREKIKIKVLIVDDSLFMRELIAHILSGDPDIEIVGTASDGEEALRKVLRKKPDLVTMDYHMPKMNGLEATRKIMEVAPIPIIMVTGSISPDESTVAFRALDAGAVSVVARPLMINGTIEPETAKAFREAVKYMSEIKVVRRWPRAELKPKQESQLWGPLDINPTDIKLIVIGASTGGPILLKKIISNLPKDFPIPILIVQHIAQGFTDGLVSWLGQVSGFAVRVGKNGAVLEPSHVYFAPEEFHTTVTKQGKILLEKTPPINGHRPSVGVLFRSVAENYDAHAMAILLTGMGKDGAVELKQIKDRGGITIVQDEDSSVVYGMPGEAKKLNAASLVLNPDQITTLLMDLASTIKLKEK